MASGLSMPVGFKNGTDGSLATAINAMRAAAMPHRFVGINQAGQVCLLQTQGNHHQRRLQSRLRHLFFAFRHIFRTVVRRLAAAEDHMAVRITLRLQQMLKAA